MSMLKSWPYPYDYCQSRRAWTAGAVVYEGYSPYPDALPAEAKWVIMKHLYSGTDDIGTVFADNSDLPIKVWDNRADYTYQSS